MVFENCSVNRDKGNSCARQSMRNMFLQAELVLLEGLTFFWTNKIVLANEESVDCFCLVTSQSAVIIDTAEKEPNVS